MQPPGIREEGHRMGHLGYSENQASGIRDQESESQAVEGSGGGSGTDSRGQTGIWMTGREHSGSRTLGIVVDEDFVFCA